jgi:2-(1,2-epoxy-1,2-dihydrophenyl)acetyl-CoA isomerase
MEEGLVLTKKHDGIKTITINREDRRNAIDPATGRMLLNAFDETRTEKDIRAAIITGAGNSFSAGADLKWTPSERDGINRIEDRVRLFQDITKAIYTLPMPTIAAVHGHAVGYGLSMALACDIRIAADDSKLGVLFTKIGLIPDGGATYFLSRLIGPGKTLELAYTADLIDAHEALRIGIVNRVVKPEDLEKEVMNLAKRLAQGAPVAYRLTKEAVHANVELVLDAALEKEIEGQAQCLRTSDFFEGVSAFLQKRVPGFKGE